MNALPTLLAIIAKMDSEKLAAMARRLETKLVEQAKAGDLQARQHAAIREIDVMTAATQELHRRDYSRPVRQLPTVVDRETVLGDLNTTVRLSFCIKVF